MLDLSNLKSIVNTEDTLGFNNHILIVDGLNTFIRAFTVNSALSANGLHIGGIVGFLYSISYAIKQLNPTRVIIVFDGAGGSQRRRKIFSEYKSNRKSHPKGAYHRRTDVEIDESDEDSSRRQLSRLVEYLSLLPVTLISIDNIEADDTIGYLYSLSEKYNKLTIMSADQDFLQLVNDKVQVWSPIKKKLYTVTRVIEEYGIHPNNFIFYKIINGDASDSIPGIAGYGIKTICSHFPDLILEQTNSIENILNSAKNIKGKTAQNLLEGKEILERNYQLMQLKDVNISGNAKNRILSIFEMVGQTMVDYKFQVMFLRDQMQGAINNLDRLLETFYNLNNWTKRQQSLK